MGEIGNMAIISPVKLAKKSPVEMKPFSLHICSMFPPENASRFRAPLPSSAARPRIETKELLGHPQVRILLELHS